ncbi:MAG: hypothetical protein COV91_01265 [Candidatus Taylorbacteria bacterium CG11_big_fil_rev_8_21_14_0_20_46_11]|uniref:Type II secretion system protein GspI C-terminal domain-containing protein n=1 Tax=Candidatus Taylorbacteria bacterium CG11_big_fil_rev_8_21_14_0_20_46_11 TaxID=1975025 RepID=A0A2H0KF03_9BACT|nr:MAG: hypothetical protein COV91_01265 [Candidatus Taylorbacteria bacterium CG11_big_fil_rev_8_21_14_0_20_46_11]
MTHEICTMNRTRKIKKHYHLSYTPHSRRYGFSLIEVVIGVTLITLSLVGLTGAYSFYIKAGLRNTDSLKSSFLLQEGVESVTLMRDDAWSNLSALTPGNWYHLEWNGNMWKSTTSPQVIDSLFTRTFTLDAVYRRTSDTDIVASSSPDTKSLDPNIKKLTVRVTTDAIDKQVVTYLTNLFE